MSLEEIPEPHPARLILDQRGMTIRSMAQYLGMNEHHLSRVLNGWEPASQKVRKGVSHLLGLPEERCFRPREPRPPLQRPKLRSGRRPRGVLHPLPMGRRPA